MACGNGWRVSIFRRPVLFIKNSLQAYRLFERSQNSVISTKSAQNIKSTLSGFFPHSFLPSLIFGMQHQHTIMWLTAMLDWGFFRFFENIWKLGWYWKSRPRCKLTLLAFTHMAPMCYQANPVNERSPCQYIWLALFNFLAIKLATGLNEVSSLKKEENHLRWKSMRNFSIKDSSKQVWSY